MEIIEFTLEEFYNLIWSKPLLSLSKEYMISDNGLRKKCRKYGIPLPPNGYWNTTDNRRKTLKKSFRCDKTYKEETIILELRNLNNESGPNRIKYLENEINEKYKTLLNHEGNLIKSIPIIAEIQKKADNGNKRGPYFSKLNHPIFIGDLKLQFETLKIKRVLVIINTLFKILVDYGFDKTALSVGRLMYHEILFSLKFREMLTISKYIDDYGRNSQTLIPNGKLEIILFEGWWDLIRFSDRKTNLDSKLATISAKIITTAEERYKKHLIREEEKKEKIKRERYNEIRNKIIKHDNKNFELFAQDYDTWQKMLKLNEFISIIENTIVNPAIEAHKQEWLVWAKEKAIQMDPLKLGVENYLAKFEIVPIPEEI